MPEVRWQRRRPRRLREAAQMGFERCILPARNIPSEPAGIETVGVNTLEEALRSLSLD